jgi:5'-methylthioadenosine phosphorylase
MTNSSEKQVVLGVLGGSGVYKMPSVKIVEEHEVMTPFGNPSDKVIEGKIGSRTVFFIPRHGSNHTLIPSDVPYRANIYALKQLGVTHLLAVSAVGIMQEGIRPGDLVIPDQIFDRTKGIRPSTFFGEGVVGHFSFAEPFCDEMRNNLIEASCEYNIHEKGTYVCMEGPQFSTRAESNYYRKALQATVIGMTGLPEAKLAREAEMCYAMLALATDYDCWKDDEESVSVDGVLTVLRENAARANGALVSLAEKLPTTSSCECLSAARFSIMTDVSAIPRATKEKLKGLYGHYWS